VIDEMAQCYNLQLIDHGFHLAAGIQYIEEGAGGSVPRHKHSPGEASGVNFPS